MTDETQTKFLSDSKRDAYSSIRGFMYQAAISLQRWIDLKEGQRLYLELGEDLARTPTEDEIQRALRGDEDAKKTILKLEQVKQSESNYTLNSDDVIEALADFWGHQQANEATHKPIFVFTTNAGAGKENNTGLQNTGDPNLDGKPGLEVWNTIAMSTQTTTELKEVLEMLKKLLLDNLKEKYPSENGESTEHCGSRKVLKKKVHNAWRFYHDLEDLSLSDFHAFVRRCTFSVRNPTFEAFSQDKTSVEPPPGPQGSLQQQLTEKHGCHPKDVLVTYHHLIFCVLNNLSQKPNDRKELTLEVLKAEIHGVTKLSVEQRTALEQVSTLLQEMHDLSFRHLNRALRVQDWTTATETLDTMTQPTNLAHASRAMQIRLLNTAVAKHFYLGETDEDIDEKIALLEQRNENAAIWHARKLAKNGDVEAALAMLKEETDEPSICLKCSIELTEYGTRPTPLYELPSPGPDALCIMALGRLMERNYPEAQRLLDQAHPMLQGLSDWEDIQAFVHYWKSMPGMKPELPFLPNPAPNDYILRDPETISHLQAAAGSFKAAQTSAEGHSEPRFRRARYYRMCCLGNILGAEQELTEVVQDILKQDPLDVFALAWVQMRNLPVDLKDTQQKLLELEARGEIQPQHIQALVDVHLNQNDLQGAIQVLHKHRSILGDSETEAYLSHLTQVERLTSLQPEVLKAALLEARKAVDTEVFFQAFSALAGLQEWLFLEEHVDFCIEKIQSDQAVFKCAYVRFNAGNIRQQYDPDLEGFFDFCLGRIHQVDQRNEVRFLKARFLFSQARIFEARDYLLSIPHTERNSRILELLLHTQMVVGDIEGYLKTARVTPEVEGWSEDLRLDVAALVSVFDPALGLEITNTLNMNQLSVGRQEQLKVLQRFHGISNQISLKSDPQSADFAPEWYAKQDIDAAYMAGEIPVSSWSRLTQRPVTERFWTECELHEKQLPTPPVTVLGRDFQLNSTIPTDLENKQVFLDVTALLAGHPFKLMGLLSARIPVMHVTPFCLPALLDDLQKIPKYTDAELQFFSDSIALCGEYGTFVLPEEAVDGDNSLRVQALLKQAAAEGAVVVLAHHPTTPDGTPLMHGQHWISLDELLAQVEDRFDLDASVFLPLRKELGLGGPIQATTPLHEKIWLPEFLLEALYHHGVTERLTQGCTVQIGDKSLQRLKDRQTLAKLHVQAVKDLKALIGEVAIMLQKKNLQIASFDRRLLPFYRLGSAVELDRIMLQLRFDRLNHLFWMDEQFVQKVHLQEKRLSRLVSIVEVLGFLRDCGSIFPNDHARFIRRLQKRGYVHLPLVADDLLRDMQLKQLKHWQQYFETACFALSLQQRFSEDLSKQNLARWQEFIQEVCQRLCSTRHPEEAAESMEWLFKHLFAGRHTFDMRAPGWEIHRAEALEHDAAQIALHMSEQNEPAALAGFLDWAASKASAGSWKSLDERRELGAIVVCTDPGLHLLSTQHPLMLHHCPFSMQPFRFDVVQPRASLGQKTTQNPDPT